MYLLIGVLIILGQILTLKNNEKIKKTMHTLFHKDILIVNYSPIILLIFSYIFRTNAFEKHINKI